MEIIDKGTVGAEVLWGDEVDKLNANFVETRDLTGWGAYNDTIYTDVSPLGLLAGIATPMPNNKGSVIEAQLPSDVTTFYDGSTIVGQDGDALLITIDFDAIPTAAGTEILDIWFDIGGGIGEIYRRPITFPRGNGIERHISFTVLVYTLNTWELNGATVYAQADNTCDIYNIRYIIARAHKAVTI